METAIDLLAGLADAEFAGDSFNGPSFMKTLESLCPEVAAAQAHAWRGLTVVPYVCRMHNRCRCVIAARRRPKERGAGRALQKGHDLPRGCSGCLGGRRRFWAAGCSLYCLEGQHYDDDTHSGSKRPPGRAKLRISASRRPS